MATKRRPTKKRKPGKPSRTRTRQRKVPGTRRGPRLPVHRAGSASPPLPPFPEPTPPPAPPAPAEDAPPWGGPEDPTAIGLAPAAPAPAAPAPVTPPEDEPGGTDDPSAVAPTDLPPGDSCGG